MIPVADRALAAAVRLEYGGPESRALLRFALDADHETGENCVTSLARVHEAAGYADDPRYRTARRTVLRFLGDDVLRCDLDAPGLGRLFTVCPIAPWSGSISTRTTLGRRLASALARRAQTPDPHTSGVAPDTQASGVQAVEATSTPDVTPDTTPDVFTSDDQRTNGPTTSLTPNVVEGRRESEGKVIDFSNHLARSLSMNRTVAS